MSEPFWTLDRVAAALESCAAAPPPRGPAGISAVSTDSRSALEGGLFVAIQGQRYDAHDFLRDAVVAGAAAVVVSRPVPLAELGVPVYRVDDTLAALGALARYRRRAWRGTLVAVTGSNGKTTTRDFIRAALSGMLDVHATTGNLNNRVGLPLTLLALPAGADVAVLELGTSLPGEVAILRDICEPDVAVVTSVSEEHLEGLGSLERVLEEETACYAGTRIGIAPSSQPEIVAAARRLAEQVVTAGLADADVVPGRWSLDEEGRGILELAGVEVRLALRGEHNLRNAMLALAVSRACGVEDTVAARGMAAMPAPKMRLAWEKIGRATLINDAYNANPGSAREAIAILEALPDERQRVLVLGTMRELGRDSDRYHDEISRLALGSKAGVVAGIGDFAASLSRLAPNDARVIAADSVDDAWKKIAPRLAPDAVILLKASRGVQLEGMVPHIVQWAER